MALLVALVWVFAALRLTREDVGGIDAPDGPIAVVQLLVAVLGGLGAGVGASRAGWYLRTGQEGREAAAAIAGAAALVAAWLVLVLPDW